MGRAKYNKQQRREERRLNSLLGNQNLEKEQAQEMKGGESVAEPGLIAKESEKPASPSSGESVNLAALFLETINQAAVLIGKKLDTLIQKTSQLEATASTLYEEVVEKSGQKENFSAPTTGLTLAQLQKFYFYQPFDKLFLNKNPQEDLEKQLAEGQVLLGALLTATPARKAYFLAILSAYLEAGPIPPEWFYLAFAKIAVEMGSSAEVKDSRAVTVHIQPKLEFQLQVFLIRKSFADINNFSYMQGDKSDFLRESFQMFAEEILLAMPWLYVQTPAFFFKGGHLQKPLFNGLEKGVSGNFILNQQALTIYSNFFTSVCGYKYRAKQLFNQEGFDSFNTFLSKWVAFENSRGESGEIGATFFEILKEEVERIKSQNYGCFLYCNDTLSLLSLQQLLTCSPRLKPFHEKAVYGVERHISFLRSQSIEEVKDVGVKNINVGSYSLFDIIVLKIAQELTKNEFLQQKNQKTGAKTYQSGPKTQKSGPKTQKSEPKT